MITTQNNTQTVVLERELPHPPEKVWRALTQQPLIEDWLMANDFEPKVGHRFTLKAPASQYWNGVTVCEVLVVEPCTRLSYSWNATGEEAARGPRTVVDWTLEPKTGGTLVRLEQSGFREEQKANYEGAQIGWEKFLVSLERVTATLA